MHAGAAVLLVLLAAWGGTSACGHDWSAGPAGDADAELGETADGETTNEVPDDAVDRPPGDDAGSEDVANDGLPDAPDDAVEVPAGCGNGTREGDEECDDGNTAGGDGCSAVCRIEACGNGVLDVGEACEGEVVECPTSCGSLGSALCLECMIGSECLAPDERCNGIDDDCNGATDEVFACVPGSTVACSTSCGSVGSGICLETCEPTPPDGCEVPDESCNGIDDNCDGAVDEGCTPAGNDLCSGPWPITGGGTFTGSTAGMTDNSRNPPDCGGFVPVSATGPEVYFYFDLAETSDVFLHTIGSAFDTVLYVGRTCGAPDMGCNDDLQAGSAGDMDRLSVLALSALAPGRYYVTLDGYDSSESGPYALTMYATPTDREGDRCGRPIPIDRGDELLTGDNCVYSDEVAGGCRGFEESVYYFTVSSPRTVAADACSSGTAAPTTLSLRRDCMSPASELACSDGGGVPCTTGPDRGAITASLEPGIYFLFVENGRAARCGTFEVGLDGL
jgi:cysteine-rich repeat protein